MDYYNFQLMVRLERLQRLMDKLTEYVPAPLAPPRLNPRSRSLNIKKVKDAVLIGNYLFQQKRYYTVING